MCVHLHKCTQYTQYIYSYYIHAYLYHLIYTSIYVCVCIRAHDFITMFPILIQYSRVLSFYLFFLFYHNCCFLSQSAKTDNHYSQFTCSILESTKNGFRIANLCFCKKGGLLSSNFFFYSCFFFFCLRAYSHITGLKSYLGLLPPFLLQFGYIIDLKYNFFVCIQFESS